MFEEAYKQLNDAQQRAVDTIDGPVLVVAGPGTGKTQLLSMRVANILQKTDVTPQNILCMTFTEDAANNMRERLASIIGQAAYDVEIHTFHSFGAGVIARFGEYFYQGVGSEPIDELGAYEIYQDIFKSLPQDNPLSMQFEGEFFYLRGTQSAVDNFKSAGLAPDEVGAIAQSNLDFVAGANPKIAEVMDGFVRIDKTAPERFEKLFEIMTPLTQATPSNSLRGRSPHGEHGPARSAESRVARGGLREGLTTSASQDILLPEFIKPLAQILTEALHAALETVKTSGKTTTLTEFKNAFLVKNSAGQWQLKDSEASKKLLALADVYERYLLKLREANLIDFNDMITRVVHATETFAELRLNLQEQYQYILVDEFQDTSLAQLRLIRTLTDNPVLEGRPNILAVGDDDQAIYSFQGAELSNILSFHQMYRDVQVITLTENYRSRQAVLDAAKFVIEQSQQRLVNQLAGVTKNIVARGQNLPEPLIQHHRFAGATAERQWVAREIKKLIDEGTPASTIAIIAAKHRGLREIVPFLTAEGVPLSYDKRENILEVPAVQQLLRMARLVLALSQGDQNTANALLPEVLSDDFWGLSTKQIWQLFLENYRKRSPWLEIALQSGDAKIIEIANFFQTLAMKASNTSLELMLDYLIGNEPLAAPLAAGEQLSFEPAEFICPFKAYYFNGGWRLSNPSRVLPPASPGTDSDAVQPTKKALNDGGASPESYLELLSHLTFLRDRLREFRATDQTTLADLIRYTNLLQSAGIQLVDSTPHRTAKSAVSLHTAHSAKGLEFTAVFVIDANHDIWMNAGDARGKIAMPTNVPIERRSGDEEERRRLLYVAMTRAKSQLFITGFDADKRGNAPLKFLTGSDTLAPQNHDAAAQTGADIAAQLTTSWHDRHLAGSSHADLRELLQPRLENYRLSATHLQRFLNVAEGGPSQWFLECLLHFPRRTEPNMAFGSAVHATLESAQKYLKQQGQRRPVEELLNDFTRALERARLEPDDFARFNDFGHKVLTQYLGERYSSFQPQEYFEFDLSSRNILLPGNVRITGKIDRITPLGNNEVRVTDFKTGKPMFSWESSDPLRAVRLYHYKQQLAFYRLLLEESSAFGPSTHVTQTALEYVQPDADGHLAPPLEYEPSDKDVARLRALTTAVWQRICNLDLPDVSGYDTSLKGIVQFENDLLTEGE